MQFKLAGTITPCLTTVALVEGEKGSTDFSLLVLWLKTDNASNILAYLPRHRQYIKILQERSRTSEVG